MSLLKDVEPGTRLVVMHGVYSETGCCGHVIALASDPDGWRRADFTFVHPDTSDLKAWAEGLLRKELGEEHVADLDWEHSEVFTYETCPM